MGEVRLRDVRLGDKRLREQLTRAIVKPYGSETRGDFRPVCTGKKKPAAQARPLFPQRRSACCRGF